MSCRRGLAVIRIYRTNLLEELKCVKAAMQNYLFNKLTGFHFDALVGPLLIDTA